MKYLTIVFLGMIFLSCKEDEDKNDLNQDIIVEKSDIIGKWKYEYTEHEYHNKVKDSTTNGKLVYNYTVNIKEDGTFECSGYYDSEWNNCSSTFFTDKGFWELENDNKFLSMGATANICDNYGVIVTDFVGKVTTLNENELITTLEIDQENYYSKEQNKFVKINE